jgi:hypothetical protein
MKIIPIEISESTARNMVSEMCIIIDPHFPILGCVVCNNVCRCTQSLQKNMHYADFDIGLFIKWCVLVDRFS